jgi:hypothetical protein
MLAPQGSVPARSSVLPLSRRCPETPQIEESGTRVGNHGILVPQRIRIGRIVFQANDLTQIDPRWRLGERRECPTDEIVRTRVEDFPSTLSVRVALAACRVRSMLTRPQP